MNRIKILLILSIGALCFNLNTMDGNVKKKIKGFISPEEVFPALLENEVENHNSTIVKKRVHVPLAFSFHKLFEKPWYIGLGDADGSGLIESFQREFVVMAFDLFSTVYIDDHEGRKKKCSIVTHNFLNNLNKHRPLIKQMLNLTEIDTNSETLQQSQQNKNKEIVEPKNVYDIIQQRFPCQDIDMRQMHKSILENLLINANQGTVTIAMNESFKQPKHNKSDKRRASFFSPASFVLGSATSLGLIGILYVPQLYHWLRTK